MTSDYIVITEHLLVALAAGGVIGFERSFHGRPAGFRTHTLVSLASCALMLVTLYGALWFPAGFSGQVNLDPTRMAQGIMTGIGFLGAGVIFKEGLTVRGLTTAASIWITSAIGILAGIGFYFPLVVATLLTLGTLTVFRWVESLVPSEFYAQLVVRFPHQSPMPQDAFRDFLKTHGFSIAGWSYQYDAESYLEYQVIVMTRRRSEMMRLSEALVRNSQVKEFTLSPAGD